MAAFLTGTMGGVVGIVLLIVIVAIVVILRTKEPTPEDYPHRL